MINTLVTHEVCLLFLSGIAYFTYEWSSQPFLYLAGGGCFVLISFLLASCIDYALPRFRVPASNKAVFITGCDRGFGRLLARRLDSMGYKVFAGCFNPDSEDTRQLRDTVSNNLEILPLNVTQDDSVQQVLKTVKERLGQKELWAVVNNAGVIERGELEWTPMDIYHKQFEVNTFGVVRVTQAFLPLIRKFKGRVVTITSIGGRQTFSGFVPYCMSKYATLSFCEGLRLEMQKFGVKVITVEPFSYQTGMTEMSTVLKSVQETWRKSSYKFLHDVYDEEYIHAFSDSVQKFNKTTALPNPTKVIDSLVEAVTAVSPHYSYLVGDLKWLVLYWFSRRVPKTLDDHFMRETITFDSELGKYLEEKQLRKKNT